jgi:hypothetical protein
MRAPLLQRLLSAGGLAGSLALGACATGTSAPPALAYRLPDQVEMVYAAGDSLAIEINALGQTLELTMSSTATYDVAFARGAADGVRVTLSVRNLQAQVSLPMAGPLTVDEEIVQGDLVLAVGRRGDVTILESPDVEEAASAFFAGPTIAHSFFPALPGRPVRPGDTWVDTVSYAEDGDTGESSQRSILRYTVLGDTTVDGRSLLEIGFEGTQEMRQTMSLQGADVEQETNLTVEGTVLWDLQRASMFERRSVSRGTGTVRVAAMPTPLPTRVEARSRVRLQGS